MVALEVSGGGKAPEQSPTAKECSCQAQKKIEGTQSSPLTLRLLCHESIANFKVGVHKRPQQARWIETDSKRLI